MIKQTKQMILALMAIVMMMLCSQTAKAEDVMYATLTDNKTVLTFYYKEKPSSVEEGYVYDVPTESKTPSWNRSGSLITTVVFDSSFDNAHPTSCKQWFSNFNKLESITGIEYLHTDNVTDMSEMFYYCVKLGSLDVSKFNTEKVTTMYCMFSNCRNLTSLDVSKFNTALVDDMSSMFSDCYALTYLDVTNFKTENVTKMSAMFCGCYVLTGLDVSKFNTEKVTNMFQMFSGCKKLESINISSFKTDIVTNMFRMFENCSGLKSLDVSKFNTTLVKNMSSMFSGCSGLTDLNVSNFNTENVTDMSSMFSGCSGLTTLNVSNFNTEKVTNMFAMFSGCSGLTTLNVSNFNTEKVTNMSAMFSGCSRLTDLDVTKFKTTLVNNMSSMFSGCSGLSSLDVSKFNTNIVTDMSSMFNRCQKLISLDLTSFNTALVNDMGTMFRNCSNLKTIYVSESFTTSAVTSSTSMFSGCSSLVGAIPYNSSTTDNTYANYKTGYFKTYCKVGETLYDMCGEELKVDNLALTDGKDFTAFMPFTATNVSYSRDLSASTSKWGTLCLPFEYTPAGFEAYQLTSLDNENSIITLEKIEGTIAEGTPVLFKKPEEGSINISETEASIVTLPAEVKATEVGNLKLVGTYQAKTFTNADNNCFILKSDKLMNTAKIFANGNVTKVGLNAYRAYMVNETSSSEVPQAYSIETGDGTTVINSLNIMTGEGAEYYDINGCRTNGLRKGLNIVRQGNKTMKIIIK